MIFLLLTAKIKKVRLRLNLKLTIF
uniref:Uncharacterized protein n=1 Tax=Arundo donax TaxID=35708 RepID=A0A0A9FLY1_ARUDO